MQSKDFCLCHGRQFLCLDKLLLDRRNLLPLIVLHVLPLLILLLLSHLLFTLLPCIMLGLGEKHFLLEHNIHRARHIGRCRIDKGRRVHLR